ncbi:MAG: type I polyketide synthase [Acidobacteriota bacterium]
MSQHLSNLKRALVKLQQMEARLEAAEERHHEALAVVGVGCRFPAGASSPEAYWRVLRDGVDGVREMPAARWPQGQEPPRGGFLEAVDGFDAAFFGISPREAATLDPQQRLLLEVAWEALEDAGLSAEALAGTSGGVFAGLYNNDYRLMHLADPSAVDLYSGTGTIHGLAANRLSYLLDLRGPSLAVDTTCSSSLVALHLACRALRAGDCDVALAAGVNLVLAPVSMRSAELLVPPAADARCKAFDAAGDGIVRGEGCGVVVLKRLSDVAAGDRVRALIRGTAVNQDGRSNGLTAPNPEAQREVIRRALDDGRVAAADLSYAEAHGTGTPLGDPIELEALEAELAVGREAGERCRVGSVKTNFGHLEAAAGIAGLIKTVLALEHRQIPPQLHFERLNPAISLRRDVLEIARQGAPWEAHGEAPRRAGVAAFSIGGTNAYAVLEEAPPVAATAQPDGSALSLLPLSAKTPQALRDLAAELQAAVTDRESLADLIYTAACRRTGHRHRTVLTGRDAAELRSALAAFANRGEGIVGEASERAGGRVFVYSGQGGQRAGMGRELLATQPVFRAAFERCDELFRELLGQSPRDEIERPPETSRLARTEFAQPALFSLQVALTELWRSWGVAPEAVVGHSLGEAAAAWACGALELAAAARVVAERCRRMATLEGRGAMLAVELSAAEAAAWERPGVRIAALNGPRSTVLSGDSEVVAEVQRELAAEAIRCRSLAVRCAFHSHQVEPLRAQLAAALDDLESRSPRLPFFSTVDGGQLAGRPLDGSYWAANLADPVRFAPAVAELLAQGFGTFLEIGPHPVLAADVAAEAGTSGHRSQVVASQRRGADDPVALGQALATLWIGGHEVRWEAVVPAGRVESLPAYPWQRQRHWLPATQAPSAPSAGRTSTAEEPFAVRCLGTAVPLYEVSWGGPLFDDHRIEGTAIVPATVVLEAVQSACGEQPCRFLDLSFERPLMVPDGGSLEAQIRLGDDSAFEVFARGDAGDWQVHVRGRLATDFAAEGSQTDDRFPLVRLRDELEAAPAGDGFYDQLAALGVALGPSLRGVAEIYRRDDEVLARIRRPEAVAAALRPALLDACLQPLAAAWPGRRCLLVAAERIDLPASLPSELWSHLRTVSESGGLRAEVTLCDGEGRCLATLSGLRFRDFGAAPPEAEIEADLLEQQWQSVAAPLRPEPSRLVANLDLTGELASYGELVPAVDALCADYARAALAAAGGIEPERRAWGERLAVIADSPSRRAAGELPAGTTAGRLAALHRQWPQHRAELDLLARCGRRLGAVLVGEQDPLELLFPGGSLQEAEEVYGRSPFAEAFNGAAREVVARWVGERGNRPLRVLEVGAGTGATTAALLEVLPQDDLDYLFTDIGPLFLQRAAERFAARPAVRFARFDIESDALPAGSFDLVVASNVLHATADLRQTLARVEECLADDGLLLLIEGTPGRRWADLTFGMTDGWWRRRDLDLRPDHPLLAPQSWCQLLAEVGFEDPVAVTGGSALPEAALLLARRRPRALGDGLVLADEDETATALTSVLDAAGARVERWPLARAGAVADWAAAAEQPRGWLVVAAPGIGGEAPLPPATDLCAAVLSGLQGLATAAPTARPRLWLVDAEASTPERDEAAPVGAVLWGLATAISAEHRELWGGVASLAGAASAERWLAEVRQDLGDRWQLRGAQGERPRWGRPSGAGEAVAIRSQGTYLITGGAGGMGREVARWLLAEGAGRVVLASRRGAEDERVRDLLASQIAEVDEGRLEVVSLDVTESAAVATRVAELARHERPLVGIIHAAGVFDDRTLLVQDRERFERVLAPKVAGAWNLHRASRALDLDLFVLFSSAVTLLPMAGLSNYTAANAFLGALAESRRGQGLPAVAIEWGGWQNVGMAEAVGGQRQEQWRRLGLEPLSVASGLAVLARAPSWPSARLAALRADWERLAAALPAGLPPGLEVPPGAAEASPAATATDWLDTWCAALAGERRELMATRVQREAVRVMMLPAGQALDRRSALSDLGLDSLMAVELRNGLSAACGVDLPATVLFDHPSVEALSDHLVALLGAVREAPKTSSTAVAGAGEGADGDDELAEVLAALDDLPEAELRAVLASMEMPAPPGGER